jgi:hypothetical protein
MRYMFLVYSTEAAEAAATPEAMQQVARLHQSVMTSARDRGVFLAADPLKPTSTATTVRTKDGTAITIDGPFAETKEQLAGYYILDCNDLDEAIEWARQIPSACFGGDGCIEIRPIREMRTSS